LSVALDLIFSFDPQVYKVVWTSVYISLIAVGAASVIAIPLGLVTALNSFPGKALLIQTLNTLMALPTVVVGLLLYGLLSRQGAFGQFGLLYTPGAVIIGESLLIIPILWNLSISAVQGADPRLEATCRGLGAGRLQLALIFLTELRYGFISAIVIGFGRAIGEVGIAMMVGGNIEGFTRTMTTAIALETSKGEFELALALGTLLLVVAFAVNGCFQFLQKQTH